MRLLRLLGALLLAAAPLAAQAQVAVLQSGPTTAGHAPMYVGSGQQPVVVDSGTAGGGVSGTGLSELGITLRGIGTPPFANAGTGPSFTNLCDYDAPTTNPTGYHWLCLGPNSSGGAVISTGAGGAAAQQPLVFSVNGAAYSMGGANWLSGWLDSQFGSTPGNVLYRGASSWGVLAPGNSGQVLETLGTSPPYVQWGSIAGTGTVTSITAGTGLNGGTITTSGTISLTAPVTVPLGGTGDTTATAHAAVIGEGVAPYAFAAPGVAGTCLASNGVSADPSFQPCPGTGTVSSVGLSDASTSPIFAIGGSPVTVSGTLTETLKTQSANTFFAGPTTGAAAQPAFRAMVDADLPGGTTGSGAVVLATSPSIASPTTTGKLTTAASAAGGAGLILPPGSAPTSPANGDVWTTSAGLYARINGSTVGPMGANTAAGVTSNVQYNNSGAFAANSGFVYDGTSVVTLGVSGASVGSVAFNNATTGSISLAPPTGALGTVTLTLPDATDTLAAIAASQTLTNKTMGSGDTWNGNIVTGTYGGTGANNGASTITIGASLTTTGAGAPTLAFPASSYTYTFPASTGTVAETGLAQTWTAAQTFTNSLLKLLGSSTGATTFASANSGASNYTLTFPAVTDTVLTATTGPGAVTGAVKSNGSGTFSQAACADLSNGAALCSLGVGTGLTSSAGNANVTNPVTATSPTTHVFTSGSGTYTTPAGVKWIRVRMIGGGGGGGGGGTGGGDGGNGGNTTFGTSLLTANGGAKGTAAGNFSAGGTATGGDVNLTGGGGGSSSTIAGGGVPAGYGCSGPFGGGGGSAIPGGNPGQAAQANTGAGGAGGGGSVAAQGGGGACGGYLEKIISSPSATYTYTIGAAGSAGSAGTSGAAGGAGGSGLILVEEHYNY